MDFDCSSKPVHSPEKPPGRDLQFKRGMNDLDWLAAMEAIRQLKACYFLCIDGKRWEELRELFTPDATIDTGGQGHWRGRDSFVDKVSALFVDAVTLHNAGMPLITLHSLDAASGIWTMEDRLWFADTETPGGWRHWRGVGRYYERYACMDGRWLIQTLRLERVDQPRFASKESGAATTTYGR